EFDRVRIGENVKSPLVGDANSDVGVGVIGIDDNVVANQRRIGARALVFHRLPVVIGAAAKTVGQDRQLEDIAVKAAGAGQTDGVCRRAITAGNNERVVLDDIVRVLCYGVDVDPVAGDGNCVIGAKWRIEEHIFHIVDEIDLGGKVRVPGEI